MTTPPEPLRIHFFQHVSFEGPANIGRWAEQRGHTISSTRLDLEEPLPSPDSLDWLVVMGGPMSIHDEHEFPWLVREREFLRRWLADARPLLGVCLGAQLAADALGATVQRNNDVEIGWFPITLTADGQNEPLLEGFEPEFIPMHWHGETFGIPPGGKLLASSEACTNQAFLVDDCVLGLQFHLDYGPHDIESMLSHCGSELTDGPFIQSAAQIREQLAHTDQTQKMLNQLLDAFASRIRCDH